MANTTNFGWETPDDTDLVKDGAAAIRTLGSAIDTSMVDLKGGTTGQILSKATNTDMDFTWITNDVGDITEVTASAPLTGGGSSGSITVGIQDGTTTQKGAVQLEDSTSSTSTTKAATPNSVKSAYDLAGAAIAKSLIDAEGDLIVGDAADAVQRLAIGSNGNVLTVDTSVDGKIKWAAPAGGTATYVGCAIYQNTNLTVSNNTATALNFQAEQYDTDAFHSTVTNTTRMTIPSGKAGKYLITAMINTTNNMANYAFLMIYLNGSAITTNGVDGGKFALTKAADDFLQGSVSYTFAVNDYIEIYLLHNSGGDRTVSAARCSLDYLGA